FLLPSTVAFVTPAVPGAMAGVAGALGADTAAGGLWDLGRRLGAPASLAELGLAAADLDPAPQPPAAPGSRRAPRRPQGGRPAPARPGRGAAPAARRRPRRPAAGGGVHHSVSTIRGGPNKEVAVTDQPVRPSLDELVRAGRLDRRRFLRLTGATGAAVGLSGRLAACKNDEDSGGTSGGAQGRAIKLGYVSPQTGPLAGFGEADTFILDGVRAALKDGLRIGGTAHAVEILVKDSQSDPNRAATVAGDLIPGSEVDLILATGTPETTNPVADQAEANGVPAITSVAPWQPYFFGRKGDPEKPFKWTYHFFWGLEDIIQVFTNLWAEVPTNKVVGALWPNDGDGNAWGDPKQGFPPALEEAGYKVVDP